MRYIVGLWNRRWFIIGLAWLLALIGWAVIPLLPKSYISSSQIYINTNTSIISVAEGTGAAQDYDKQIRIMKEGLLTRENIEALIFKLKLDQEFKDLAPRAYAVELERLVNIITASISITREEEQIFIVSFKGRNPVTAKNIVEELVQQMVLRDIGAQLQENERSIKKASENLRDWEAEVQKAELEEAKFKRENKGALASTADQDRRLELRVSELDRVDEGIASTTRRRDSLLTQLGSMRKYTAGSELDKLKIQLATLESQYNDNFPDIINLRARIAELESDTNALPTNPEYQRLNIELDLTKRELVDLRNRRARLNQEINQLTEASYDVPAIASELARILRSKEKAKSGYDAALERYNKLVANAEINEGGGAVAYVIQEKAKIPVEPASPKRGLLSLAVAILALGAAVCLAFLLAQLDKTFIQKADVDDAFGLPVLGTISPSTTKQRFTVKFMEHSALVSGFLFLIIVAGGLYWFYQIRVSDSQKVTAAQSETGLSLLKGVQS
ncbi:MAG: Wzz/FepE/Etk N-terminal domain-containing protein [bacterium]